MFAQPLGPIPRPYLGKLAELVRTAKWREVPGRQYDTADVEFWKPCDRAFLIRIPPKGNIHRHHDAFIKGTTHHYVIQTNEGCLNWWIADDGSEQSCHMKQGYRYEVQRAPMHWAENKGYTDMIHRLVEYA